MATDFMASGGMDYARKMLLNAFGPEVAEQRLLERVEKALGTGYANSMLCRRPTPSSSRNLIHSEHPQTIALVLSHFKYSQAAALLTSLPVGLRADVVLRMANLDQISPDVIRRLPE